MAEQTNLSAARERELRADFHKWVIDSKLAYEDDRHGLCFFDSGSGRHLWSGYLAGRRATPARQEGDDARDAARYRWLRDWYLRDGRRSEIDPHGHVRRTTPEIMDQGIDAARAAHPGREEGGKA
jgi:hypothetical protein